MRQAESRRQRTAEELKAFTECSRMQQTARDNALRKRLGQINVHESHFTVG
jgi:hypothetical protein